MDLVAVLTRNYQHVLARYTMLLYPDYFYQAAMVECGCRQLAFIVHTADPQMSMRD